MNHIRVAHIGWLASSHLERRATELARCGIPTVVFTDAVPARLQNTELPFGVEILPSSSSHQPLELVTWLEERLAAHGMDLVHIHSTHFPAALGFFVRTVPRITSIWDFVHSKDSVSPLYHKVILDELFQGRLSEAISFSSRIILEEWTSQGLPRERGFWHSWGVDLNNFTGARDENKLATLRGHLGIGPEEKVIFSPRTPSLPVNDDLLLQALPCLEAADRVRCIVTGHAIPPEARYMERLVRKKGISDKIQFVDTIHDQVTLSLYYQLADLVVSLHSNDHNPATVLEAMGVGGLVLINESPTVEYWIQDGRNGLVARTRDLDHLVSKLNQGLSLAPETLAAWRHFNRAKIEDEANFHHTINQVIKDYQQIWQMETLSSCSPFHKGLLADICGRLEEATRFYRQALTENGQSRYLVPLIDEKNDLMARNEGITSFHEHRPAQYILQLSNVPRQEWGDRLVDLNYPKNLFRHDVIAGLYPLMSKKRFDDILYLIDLFARRFHTDTLEWLAECINWFGHRWSLWEECAGLLLLVEEGGSSLGCHALRAAKELGEGHFHYRPLLEKARDWTIESIAIINQHLDKRYRWDVHQESSLLLAHHEKAA
jgi:glycosyltransferase involved in cell wall biosynthesis